MFMRYWGGGIGHQDEGSRWKLADRGMEGNEMDVNAESEDERPHLNQDNNDILEAEHLDRVAAQLQADDNGSAVADDSQSSHSSDTNSSDSEESSDNETNSDNDEDDDDNEDTYFGPEDNERTLDRLDDGWR